MTWNYANSTKRTTRTKFGPNNTSNNRKRLSFEWHHPTWYRTENPGTWLHLVVQNLRRQTVGNRHCFESLLEELQYLMWRDYSALLYLLFFLISQDLESSSGKKLNRVFVHIVQAIVFVWSNRAVLTWCKLQLFGTTWKSVYLGMRAYIPLFCTIRCF